MYLVYIIYKYYIGKDNLYHFCENKFISRDFEQYFTCFVKFVLFFWYFSLILHNLLALFWLYSSQLSQNLFGIANIHFNQHFSFIYPDMAFNWNNISLFLWYFLHWPLYQFLCGYYWLQIVLSMQFSLQFDYLSSSIFG